MNSPFGPVTKTYPARGPLQQFRLPLTDFTCLRCQEAKRSKLLAIFSGDWAHPLCNGCYGKLLSNFEVYAGADSKDSAALEAELRMLLSRSRGS